MGTGVPLYHHQGTTKSTSLWDLENEEIVQSIKKHRVREGKLEFLVHWKGTRPSEDSWEPPTTFVNSFSHVSLDSIPNKVWRPTYKYCTAINV